jgi:hypothetical protein
MGTWGAGPLQNDTALDFVGDQLGELVAVVHAFLDAPELDHGFDRAFAAVHLIALYAEGTQVGPPKPAELAQWREVLLATHDREIADHDPKPGFADERRNAIAAALDKLDAHSRAYHEARKGVASTRLSRALARETRAQTDFTINYRELIEWALPFGDDLAALWAACDAGDRMLAIARALGTPSPRLVAILTFAVEPSLASTTLDRSARGDAIALEAWASEHVKLPRKMGLRGAAIARAAAHVARAVAEPQRDHVGLAAKELLQAEMLDASLIAEAGGMSWHEAMTSSDGPGWTAHRAANRRLADTIRRMLPANELGVR